MALAESTAAVAVPCGCCLGSALRVACCLGYGFGAAQAVARGSAVASVSAVLVFLLSWVPVAMVLRVAGAVFHCHDDLAVFRPGVSLLMRRDGGR